MSTFERTLKITKTDAFEIDVSEWADSEAITSVSVTDDAMLTSVGATQINGALLSVLLTGAVVGTAKIHFQYTTATRSDCFKADLKVIASC